MQDRQSTHRWHQAHVTVDYRRPTRDRGAQLESQTARPQRRLEAGAAPSGASPLYVDNAPGTVPLARGQGAKNVFRRDGTH